ncbi:hypothetical protein GGF50DRAFT_99948 [Schizophyllum commune]
MPPKGHKPGLTRTHSHNRSSSTTKIAGAVPAHLQLTGNPPALRGKKHGHLNEASGRTSPFPRTSSGHRVRSKDSISHMQTMNPYHQHAKRGKANTSTTRRTKAGFTLRANDDSEEEEEVEDDGDWVDSANNSGATTPARQPSGDDDRPNEEVLKNAQKRIEQEVKQAGTRETAPDDIAAKARPGDNGRLQDMNAQRAPDVIPANVHEQRQQRPPTSDAQRPRQPSDRAQPPPSTASKPPPITTMPTLAPPSPQTHTRQQKPEQPPIRQHDHGNGHINGHGPPSPESTLSPTSPPVPQTVPSTPPAQTSTPMPQRARFPRSQPASPTHKHGKRLSTISTQSTRPPSTHSISHAPLRPHPLIRAKSYTLDHHQPKTPELIPEEGHATSALAPLNVNAQLTGASPPEEHDRARENSSSRRTESISSSTSFSSSTATLQHFQQQHSPGVATPRTRTLSSASSAISSLAHIPSALAFTTHHASPHHGAQGKNQLVGYKVYFPRDDDADAVHSLLPTPYAWNHMSVLGGRGGNGRGARVPLWESWERVTRAKNAAAPPATTC